MERRGGSLEETPTWAVSVVVLVFFVTSFVIDASLHHLSKFLTRKKTKSLGRALKKIKTEMMNLGMVSFLLTITEVPISRICISEAMAKSFLPCEDATGSTQTAVSETDQSKSNQPLSANPKADYCQSKGMVALTSREGVLQPNIFISVLAVFHVLYCMFTMFLGKATMKRWKSWEEETQTVDCQMANGEQKINGDTSTLLHAQTFVWNQMFNFMNSMSLKCAVELRIPDLIHSHGGALSLSGLVEAIHLHPIKASFLRRLMRVLVRSGVFSQTNCGQEVGYTLTPTSRLLCLSDPMGISKFLFLMLDPCLLTPWEGLSRWFYSDYSTAFEMANGETLWARAAGALEFFKTFNEAMDCDSKLVAATVVKCKQVFEGLESLVDVGGGTGAMAAAIAEAFPHIHCTVFDLPDVVENLKGRKNLDFVGGDMFEAIPPANAALLKWILHDWDEEKSVEILKKCRKSIPCKEEGGKVIIIEMVMDDEEKVDDEFIEAQIYFDMLMMVSVSGAERSRKEWENLFFRAGYSSHKVVCKLGARSVMEVYH